MFTLALYLLHSLLIFPIQQHPYHASQVWYFFVPLCGEFMSICGLTVFCVYLLWYHSFILAVILCFVCIPIAIILLFDMVSVLIYCIGCDLNQYLQFDFRVESYTYGSDYAFFEEMSAYDRYDRFPQCNTQCSICQNEFLNDPINTQKQLLNCGHLYHKTCLDDNELCLWNDNQYHPFNYKYPYAKCCYCTRAYHSHFEKYNFNPTTYPQTVTHWQPEYDFYGKEFLQQNLWKSYNDNYSKRLKQTQEEWKRQFRWTLPNVCGGC